MKAGDKVLFGKKEAEVIQDDGVFAVIRIGGEIHGVDSSALKPKKEPAPKKNKAE